MLAEDHRTRLIGDLVSLLRSDLLSEEARTASLTLIGWLARRMPGEPASTVGLEEMRRNACRPAGAARINDRRNR